MEQDLGISESLAIKSLISHFNSLWLLEIESRTMYWLGFNAREKSHFSYLMQEKNKERKLGAERQGSQACCSPWVTKS